MARENFDYGTEEQVSEGGGFKQPEVGPHCARVRSLIHCGLFCEMFKGKGQAPKVKKPAPEVVAVFELKEEVDFQEDGVTPLTISKAFPLKLGDKAFWPKFLNICDPDEKAAGMDDLIGAPCMVEIKPGKELNDDGSPKYVNFGGVAAMPKKFAAQVEPLVEGLGVGHVRFEDLDEAAIRELNPVLEVANILMKGEKFKGSKAEQVIAEIRKENPNFAKVSSKQEEGEDPPPPQDVPCDLDDNKEF